MSFEHDDQLVLASEVACDFQTVRLNFGNAQAGQARHFSRCGVMTRVRPRPFSWPADPSKAFSASASTTILTTELTTDDVSPRFDDRAHESAVSEFARDAGANRERLAFQQQNRRLVRALATRSCPLRFLPAARS